MAAPRKHEHCTFDGCASAHYAKGLCRAHYHQQQRGTLGRRRSEYVERWLPCAGPGCSENVQQRSIGSPKLYCSRKCQDAARAQRRKADPSWVPYPLREGKPVCSVDGCEKPRLAKGLCSMHYERVKKYGAPGPARSHFTPGEWRVAKDGYVFRSTSVGRELQHRVVMAEMIGRPLRGNENVHHKNGDRADNRPENLELWVKPQAAGQRVEDLVAFVVDGYPEMVRAYLDGGAQT